MDGVKCSTCRGAGEIEFERGARRVPCVTCSGSGADYKKTLDAALAREAECQKQLGERWKDIAALKETVERQSDSEAALREELATEKERSSQYGRSFNETSRKLNELQPRLTAAEQRNAEASAAMQLATKLLDQSLSALNPRNRLAAEVRDFLAAHRKPTESGASE